jgi:translation initiation factor IF-1
VTLTPKKARELKISDGDVVAIIGRRRRVTYAIASVPSKKKGSNSNCSISHNLATNIRVRDGDKVKIVKLGDGAADAEERSGDMILLTKEPDVVESVTYSPIEDSLNSLINAEGGDEIEDEELMERFISPYLNIEEDGGAIVAKEGSVVTMNDENGKSLDFIVTHVDDGEEKDEGKISINRLSLLLSVCL